MKYVIYCIFIILFITKASSYANDYLDITEKVQQLLLEIGEFIKGTDTFEYPQNSKSFLEENDENITDDCEYTDQYDFIIIGGGSSGSVLANRLTEVREWQVLLLEAGGEETSVTDIPAMSEYLKLSSFNWGYKSVPQIHSLRAFINKTELIPRGKVLGGTSTLGGMLYVRGNSADYDKWSAEGNPGWSYEDLVKYFKRSENATFFKHDPIYSGNYGELPVEQINIFSPLSYSYLLGNQGLRRQTLFDYNGKEQDGFAILQTTSSNGRKYNGNKAFLKPALTRENLKVLTKSLVFKILINKNKEAYGVKYINNGTSYCVEAKKEIILSAGAINTPQLLMLSGIGPAKHLEEFDIEVINNLPGVGENLWDHMQNNLQPFVTNFTWPNYTLPEMIEQYFQGLGYLTSTDYSQNIGFVRTNIGDNSRPDMEHIFRVFRHQNPIQQYFQKVRMYSEDIYNSVIKPMENKTSWHSDTVLLHPKSRGTVKLKSKSPFDFPLIDPNYLTDKYNSDLKTLMSGYRDMIKISRTKSMKKHKSHMLKVNIKECKEIKFHTDEYYACLVQHLASGMGHLAGTCKMGPSIDKMAVVNHKLRVYGIKNLRIADCSVIPVTISGHTNAIAYVIGEKAADLLKQQHD